MALKLLSGLLIMLLVIATGYAFRIYRKRKKEIEQLREQLAKAYLAYHSARDRLKEEAFNEALAFFEKELQRIGATVHGRFTAKAGNLSVVHGHDNQG